MAAYSYDQGGILASYFLITFLALILVPTTLSLLKAPRDSVSAGCQCKQCLEQRTKIRQREAGTWLKPKFSKTAIGVTLGWVLLAYLAYNVANIKDDSKVYDPFEILGIKMSATQKEIKSHYRKLSKKFHPDKVKLTVNQTVEAAEAYFVDLTKAYKALTDETIRENWEKYGHPDGRQEVSTGIAIPAWIVEGKNNIYVLAIYGLLFGGALPALVGRWWFGNRDKTKDGVRLDTASAFWKGLTEQADLSEVIGVVGTAKEWEEITSHKDEAELGEIEKKVEENVKDWVQVKKLTRRDDGSINKARSRALVLLYSHLLRIPISSTQLAKERQNVVAKTPVLLAALLSLCTARFWLRPSLAIMRLHAHFVQAVAPGTTHLQQLPGVDPTEVKSTPDIDTFVLEKEQAGDERAAEMRKVADRWGRLECVDAHYKVIDDNVIVPNAFVNIVVRVRISPPGNDSKDEKPASEETYDDSFLSGRKDAEDLAPEDAASIGYAHAPFWHTYRKPSWWLFIADERTGKIIVPPSKITDVPYGKHARAYRLQFQATFGPQTYPWKLYLVSDTFVGEEIVRDLPLKVEDPATLNLEQTADDEISDPEEDSLAGQMAAMRGGPVKRIQQQHESDDESGTDDEKDASDSDSDSD